MKAWEGDSVLQLQAKTSGIKRNQPGWHLKFGFSASRILKMKCLLFKPSILWYFVRAAPQKLPLL